MRFGRHVPLLVFALLVALTASVPFATTAGSRRDFYFFDVELTSNSPGATQLFFDMGRGIDEPDSSVQPLRASARPVTYRYMMPTGTLRALRLDPIDREVRDGRAARLVRHLHHIHAREHLEHLPHEMHGAAQTRRAVVELARLRLH